MAVETSEVVDMIRKGDKLGVMVYLRYGGDPNTRNHMGWTLLHLACFEGQTDIAEVLLDAGASINSCTTDMSTPLHRACAQGYKTLVELLIKKNAYVNAQDKAGNTPLHEAARGFHTAIVKLLIEKKADRTRANRKNQIFLQLVGQQLMPAVEAGDVEVIMQWLEWGLSPDTKGNLHWSILHHASARGQLNIVSLLIERGGNVDVEDSNKTTPLHTSSFHGHLRIATLLVDSNANVNATDLRGNTPLHSAIEGSHPDLINLLLDRGCDTTIANSEGQIFTHLVNEFLVTAVHSSNMSQVASLLKGRADPNTRDAYGCPVLCHAAFKGDMMIADALLEAGADPDLSDVSGKTPLHHAAYWGHLFVLKALLDKNATVNVSDKNGSTPLHEAAREGVEDVITVLTGRGAKVNARDEEGNTPLHAAGKWGQVAAVQLLIEKGASDTIKNKNSLLYSDLALIRAVRTEEQTQVMAGLAWGGDPNSRDARGWTLLHHAVYKGVHDICLLLLDCGANVNAVDSHGRTPLLLAAYRGNHQIMQVLLDEGADINAQDWNGETPLHWAANEGSVDTVQLLLDHDADTNVKNKAGLLYSDLLLKHLYLAVRHKDADKVVRLVSAGANQFAEVEGIGLNPREEAKRQGLYDILRQMAALAKKEPQPEDDKIIALEDVYRLFEDGYITGDGDSDSSEEEEASEVEGAEDSDTDEEAYWKMSNAYEVLTVQEAFQEDDDGWLNAWEEKPKVISAKELFEEDQAAFWEFWEDKKPKAISAKEFFKEESNWWEDEDENDRKEEKEGNSKIISAKEFFRDDECWWRDALENLNKPKVISAKEFFDDEKPWWETDEQEKPKVILAKDFFKEDDQPWWESEEEKTKVISAKEFFKDDDQPWWETGEALEQGSPDGEVSEPRKKSPGVVHSSRYHSPFREEESEVQEKEGRDNDGIIESSDEETEESNRADNFEDATDSALSDSSTMYSASEGERLRASVVFRDTPWWDTLGEEDPNNHRADAQKASEAFQEGHWLDDTSEVSEGTETLDMDTSGMSEIPTATKVSQGSSWLQDERPYMPRVKRSRRSDIDKMRAEVDVDEDSEIGEEGKEDEVREKMDVKEENEGGGRQNTKVEEKLEEDNEISEDDDKGIDDKESSSDSEEVKSEDEMGDISDEELDAMELETEDEAEESLTRVRDSPALGGGVEWDNAKTCKGRMHSITPLVQVDMYEKENDAIRSRSGDRREMSRNRRKAKEAPLVFKADVVSKPDTVVKEDINIDVETPNTDSLLDPNQLSIYGHYMEGNLQKSDSQTSGYESSLSLSESKTTHDNKNSESRTSVVRKSHEGSGEKLVELRHNDRSRPSETSVEKCFPESVNKGGPMIDIHLQNRELETKLNTQNSNLEGKTEVKENPVQGNNDITEGAKKLVAVVQLHMPDNEHLGISKYDNNQIIDSQISEGTKANVAEHYSKPKIMYERSGEAESMGNVTLPKTYAAAVKENVGDKITVNKMDVCLAKVDASLAWVDARLMKDSTKVPSHRNSTENLGEKLRAEEVRTYAGAVRDGGSATSKYIGTGKNHKSMGIHDGSKTLDKTKGEEKDTVLLMKVHVHVPETRNGVIVTEEIPVTSPEDTGQNLHDGGGAASDNTITGGTFVGVVNNGNSDSKKLPKHISQLSVCTDVENNVISSTSQQNDQISSTKINMKTDVVTEQHPITESSPVNEEETDKDVKAEPTQEINLTKTTNTSREDSENDNESVSNKDDAIGKMTTEIASDEQSDAEDTTTHETSSSSSEDTCQDNHPSSDQRTQPQESDALTEEKKTTSHEVGDESPAEVNLENKNEKGQPRENSVERSLPKVKADFPAPSHQKTIWRCSTYEAMSLSDYDKLAFMISQSASSPACLADIRRRGWSVSVESLDKASDGISEPTSTTSTSDQKQHLNSDPVKETPLDEGSTSRGPVEQDGHRSNVDQISSSRSHCHVDQNNTETFERSDGQLNDIPSQRDSLAEEVPQVDTVPEASPVSLPAQVAAQTFTNCSENSSDPDLLPVPPRTKERKLSSQTVINKVPGYSAESQSTNALNKPTNTALLYDPDKKDVGKVVAASQVWPDLPQAHQGSAQTSSDVKLDKMKPAELAVMTGRTDPVRKSSSCRLS